jgi:hypothetical protein
MKKSVYLGQAQFLLEAGTEFLGELAKLRKATISSVMSVRPPLRLSVLTKQLRSHWTDFQEI